jgi:hypothetical protein
MASPKSLKIPQTPIFSLPNPSQSPISSLSHPSSRPFTHLYVVFSMIMGHVLPVSQASVSFGIPIGVLEKEKNHYLHFCPGVIATIQGVEWEAHHG